MKKIPSFIDTSSSAEELLVVIDKLKQEINDYEVQFEHSSDGILIIEDHSFVRCNQCIVDMLGYSTKEEFLNLHPSQLSPEYQPDGRKSFEKAEEMMNIALNNHGHRFEWVHKKANGDNFWVEVTLSPQYYPDHTAIHVIWKDISAVKSMQDQLIEKEKMSALGSLVAGVSHEINTPLGIALMGSTHIGDQTKIILDQLAKNELGKKNLTEYLRLVEELADSMHVSLRNAAELVHSFKQVAIDQHNEEKRRFNLREYCKGTLLSLKPSYRNRPIRILNNINSDIEINSYAGIFSQIITNLVMNSLIHAFEDVPNHLHSQGVIELSAELQEGVLQLNYEDDGTGISEEHIHRIFDPFFTTKMGQGGSGLGLHIIYNLINHKLNGSISCKNKTIGIKVEITIPL